jgi:hypothetical protein
VCFSLVFSAVRRIEPGHVTNNRVLTDTNCLLKTLKSSFVVTRVLATPAWNTSRAHGELHHAQWVIPLRIAHPTNAACRNIQPMQAASQLTHSSKAPAQPPNTASESRFPSSAPQIPTFSLLPISQHQTKNQHTKNSSRKTKQIHCQNNLKINYGNRGTYPRRHRPSHRVR